ncbi:hypothetical protein NDU88_004036 [Pleurodeles waltl]|uniref:Uncharacterized protein n=1 Tax=Pleurodeles waltl TaxID=8319 RepID=A0AAV7PBK8_PLEWA|nr:hypothetical protein NDU88_004036 [Pleurodeles waltl]
MRSRPRRPGAFHTGPAQSGPWSPLQPGATALSVQFPVRACRPSRGRHFVPRIGRDGTRPYRNEKQAEKVAYH